MLELWVRHEGRHSIILKHTYSLLIKTPKGRRTLFMFCKGSLSLIHQISNFHIGLNVTGPSTNLKPCRIHVQNFKNFQVFFVYFQMQGFTLLVFYFPIGFTESGPSADWPSTNWQQSWSRRKPGGPFDVEKAAFSRRCPPIGPHWSRDLNTGLWLARTEKAAFLLIWGLGLVKALPGLVIALPVNFSGSTIVSD